MASRGTIVKRTLRCYNCDLYRQRTNLCTAKATVDPIPNGVPTECPLREGPIQYELAHEVENS